MYRVPKNLLSLGLRTSGFNPWGGNRRNLSVSSEFTFPRTVGMKNLNFWRTAAIVSTIVAACLCASAADVNGRIKGTVTDPAGAVVAHATITAINKDTGVKTVITSQADGEYLFQQLPVGTYSITATQTIPCSAITFSGFGESACGQPKEGRGRVIFSWPR